MDKAGDILKSFLSFYHLEKGEKYVALFSGWRQIAGEDISSHTRIIDIRHDALVVEVDHPGWMQVLQMKQAEILARIGSRYPELGIRLLQMRLVKNGCFSEAKKTDVPAQSKPAERETPEPAAEEEPAAPGMIQDEELKKLLVRLGKKVRERNKPRGELT